MADGSSSSGPGGFFPSQTLPSPAPSTSSARSNAALPHPRAKSLRPGSSKEDTVRRDESGDDIIGYKSFAELCKDLHSVIDVLWLSATPSLQIPFLLKIASDFTQWIDAFPPSPKATFSVLTKLDHCFASLLSGRDIDTKEPLPGFENGMRAGMTTTDMVRCRSSVEQTRLVIVEVLSKEPEEDDDEVEEMDTETEEEVFGSAWDEDDDRLYMDVARVYEHTIVQLGEKLGDVFGATPQPAAAPPPTTSDGSQT
ncbi:meiotic recombination protein dmc1 [Colletotrichum karsti]|uniref:Meiotic recombination protein dmc1 n=1 Tax=Colletotrichum karsti TaxID=1095194 RepID=A0A9P6LQJ4_9PEZI|nr:meiotic recombination protein dmc1 [Colletotrichum karsti]KAF9882418.1 meiotic recombination protein dmc1 [Colletotrichum karsti]